MCSTLNLMPNIIDSLKDSSIWSSRTPYLTVCFRETVLIWIPCLFLCFSAIINYIRYNGRQNSKLFVFNDISKYKIVSIVIYYLGWEMNSISWLIKITKFVYSRGNLFCNNDLFQGIFWHILVVRDNNILKQNPSYS